MAEPPSDATVREFMNTLSNWGRWGHDDQLGTMNHITPAIRAKAATLARDGAVVSCSWDIDPTPGPGQLAGPPQRFMLGTGEAAALSGHGMGFAMEHIGLVYHGLTVTHIDGLSHVFWDGKMYNGRPAQHVNASRGATELPITTLKQGVVTRGVLLDVAATTDVPWLEAGQGVTPEMLEAAEARQGVRAEAGDVVLLRTGFGRRRVEQGLAGCCRSARSEAGVR